MIKIIKIILIFIVLLMAGFYLKDWAFYFYKNTLPNFQGVKNLQLENVLSKLKKETSTPGPLNVGGNETAVVLNKDKVIAQTNIQRQNYGLPALKENSMLNAAALSKVQDMFSKQYFEHVSLSGLDPGTLVKNHGYDYIVSGENLILGNFSGENDLVQAWMDSPGHRANILNNRFTEIGVAVIRGTYNGQTVWIGVQEFGLPLSACQEPDESIKGRIESNQKTIDQMVLQIEDKKEEIESTDRNSNKYNDLVDEYNQIVKDYNILVKETKDLTSQYNNSVNIFNQCVQG